MPCMWKSGQGACRRWWQAAAPPPQPAAPQASAALDDLFDEEGFSENVAAVCPACRQEMDAGAVLCTKCGYNIESGEKLEGHMTRGSTSPSATPSTPGQTRWSRTTGA